MIHIYLDIHRAYLTVWGCPERPRIIQSLENREKWRKKFERPMDEHWSKGFEFRFAIKKSFNGDPEPEKNSIFLLFYSLTLCVVSLLYTTTRAILRAIANAPSTCQKSKPWKIFFATGKPQSDLTLVCVSLSCKQNQTSWSRLVWLLHHWQPHS